MDQDGIIWGERQARKRIVFPFLCLFAWFAICIVIVAVVRHGQ
jgi:t-SNARE complex subunit (syntaxin)